MLARVCVLTQRVGGIIWLSPGWVGLAMTQ